MINTPKTESGTRYIPMLPQVRDALLKQKAIYKLANIKSTMEVDGLSDFVFLNRFGRPYNQGSLNKSLGRLIRDCNFKQLDSGEQDPILLPAFSNHWLRHTFVTRCVEAGLPVKVVQYVAGHKDIQVTLDIYTDVSIDYTTKEMQSLNVFFNRFCEDNRNLISYDHHTTDYRKYLKIYKSM